MLLSTEICSAEPNQPTAEQSNQPSSLQLSYDADGNATLVQTSTGTWAVEYNAENRPVRWTNAATGTVITMTFDSQGRRTEYKSVTNGAQNTWLRFLYDGYLCVQVLYSNEPYNVFKEFVWDPTEPVATRPLVFRYAPNSLNLFYAFDGNKNVSDVFYRMTSNGIGAHYDYAPFGGTTRTHSDSSASFDIVALNPFRFSSEYYDSELDLVYYNYRHYSPSLGRFLSRDPIEEQGGWNLYAFVRNESVLRLDFIGLWDFVESSKGKSWKEYLWEQGDTKAGLANLVGMEVSEFDNWATPLGRVNPTSKFACKYQVPNTVIAYWAGDCNSVGRWWIDWDENIKAFKSSGYAVEETLTPQKDGLSDMINARYKDKSLIGIYYWGHGYSEKGKWVLSDKSGKIVVADYTEVTSVPYKMKYGYFYACYTEEVRKVFDPQYGFSCEEILVPWAPWSSRWVRPKTDLEKQKGLK